MWQRTIAKERVGIADAELCRVQNDQDLGRERFRRRLAGFAADEARHVVALLAQQLLEAP